MLKKEFNNLRVTVDSYYEINLPRLMQGKYILRIIHQCEVLFKYPRSLFVTYAIEGESNNNVQKKLGLENLSEQYGVFTYVGGGKKVEDYYIQEVLLDIASNIDHLNITLRTYSRRTTGDISAIQIYDTNISKYDLFGFSYSSQVFFQKKLLSETIKSYVIKNDLEKEGVLIWLDDKNTDIQLIGKLYNNYSSLIHRGGVIFYSTKKLKENIVRNIKGLFNSSLFIDPSLFGINNDLDNQQSSYVVKEMCSALLKDLIFLIEKTEDLEKIHSEHDDMPQTFLLSEWVDRSIELDKNFISNGRFIQLDGFKRSIDIASNSSITVVFAVFNDKNKEIENSAIVMVKYLRKDGTFVLPPDSFGINPNFGTYQYIHSGLRSSPYCNQLNIPIPENENIDSIELEFKAWGKEKIENYIDISFFEVLNHQSELQDSNKDLFLDSLKDTDKIILIYTTAPYIGHETLELRPNRLTKEYIKLGYKVIFFAFSRVPEDLEYPDEYKGSLLQCHKDDLLKYISLISNKKLVEKLFICSSFPDIFALAAISRLKLFNDWKLTYEIRDDMEEFNRVGYSKWYSTQLEVKVARLVDRIMTVSPRLAKKIKIMSKHMDDWATKVRVIQNAAPDSLIDKSTYLRSPNFFQQKTESNIIGYIGHLTPAWFDWTLVLTAARDFPDLIFEIIGHGMPETLTLPENVVYLGPKNHDEFLKISERWKVGLIPFITSPLTYGVDPNKIYEYLAANLLVVTADMGSVRECPATYVYTNYLEFKIGLESALKVKYNNKLLLEIIDYVEKSHWSNRAQKMIEFIQEEI